MAAWLALLATCAARAIVFNGIDYPVPTDGVTDAQPGLKAYFAAVASASGNKSVTLPAGKYLIGLASKANQIALPSNTTIDASLAQFVFPTNLPTTNSAYPFPIAFSTADATNLTWNGGSLLGYAFDIRAIDPSTNLWQPKETPAFLYFTSTANKGCQNLTVQNLNATNFSGPVVAANGVGSGLLYSTVTTTACSNLVLSNCVFANCGKFFWDYSYLLQIICYSNQYSSGQWWMATNYMVPGGIVGPVTTTAGSSLVGFNNPGLVALNTNSTANTYRCTFYGNVPSSTPQIVAGNGYYVVSTNASGITVSQNNGGTPIVFSGNSTGSMGLVPNINAAGLYMYAPYGQFNPPLSGAFYFVDCSQVSVVGCTWSSAGDSSQFLRTANFTITGNTVNPTGMGGLFIADGSTNGTVYNNQFNLGATGSRVITLETAAGISIYSNSFIGGGRGSLIINPRNISIANNIFRTNTTKGYRDYSIGRIGPEYGGSWEVERLFSIFTDGTYNSSVAIKNNTIYTDTAHYLIGFYGYCFTNVVVTGNSIYGTSLDGRDSKLGVVYGYPAAPGFIFDGGLYSSTISNNVGLENYTSGTFCTTTLTQTNQIVIPHFLPVLWPTTGLNYYEWVGGYGGFVPTPSSNYQSTVALVSPQTPSIASFSTDPTNIYVNFSSPIPSNSTVTINWSTSESFGFEDADFGDYFRRLLYDGVHLTGSSRNAIYGLMSFKSVGWSHFQEIYPLYGTWPGVLEKLKYAGSETQLRSPGGFTSSDYGVRGLTGDGISKWLQTSLTPSSFGSGNTGGMSVFVNNTAAFLPNSGAYLLGVDDGVNIFGLNWSGTGVQGTYGGSTVSTFIPLGTLASPALYSLARSSSTSLSLYTNGVLAVSSPTTSISGGSARNICLFANANTNNSGAHFLNGTIAFAFVDDGTLSAANYATLNTAIRTYLTAISALP